MVKATKYLNPMRQVIMSLIRKVIQKEYGPLTYSVVGSNHFPLNTYPNRHYGYIVSFVDIPKNYGERLVVRRKCYWKCLD